MESKGLSPLRILRHPLTIPNVFTAASLLSVRGELTRHRPPAYVLGSGNALSVNRFRVHAATDGRFHRKRLAILAYNWKYGLRRASDAGGDGSAACSARAIQSLVTFRS
jgi:hypothetical protein